MELEKGASFSTEALLEHPTFRAWVLAGDEQAASYWQAYLELRPNEAETLDQARTLLLDLQDHFESQDRSAEAIAARLQAQLETLGSPKILPGARVKQLQPGRRWMVAASIALVIMLALGWWWQQQHTELVYSTAYAEWKTIALPDGSEVQLNANSSLRLQRDWAAGNTRRVHLQGEAYFSVHQKPETGAKFQVITDDLTVEVLGTAFNVHSRGEQTEVFLEEGSVRLEIATDSIADVFLQPGQKLAYSRRQKTIPESLEASADLYVAWKDGLLKFDKTPMREVLQKVQDIYGITFRVEREALYDRPITSQGVPMRQLDVTLFALSTALGAEISLQDEVYVIE